MSSTRAPLSPIYARELATVALAKSHCLILVLKLVHTQPHRKDLQAVQNYSKMLRRVKGSYECIVVIPMSVNGTLLWTKPIPTNGIASLDQHYRFANQ